MSVFSTPRPLPNRRIPAIGGTIVVLVALPVILLGGWRLGSWVLVAALWAAFQAIGLVLQRLPLGMGSLASAGVVAFGRMFRGAGLVAILIAITVSDTGLGVTAAIVYGIAFTVEFLLSLLVYFGGESNQ